MDGCIVSLLDDLPQWRVLVWHVRVVSDKTRFTCDVMHAFWPSFSIRVFAKGIGCFRSFMNANLRFIVRIYLEFELDLHMQTNLLSGLN